MMGVFVRAVVLVVYTCTIATALELAQPDYTLYKHKDELLHATKAIAERNLDVMQIDMLEKESDGYKTNMQVITLEPGGLTADRSHKARILMDFGEHGREYISSELGLRFLELFEDEARLERLIANASRYQHLTRMLHNTVFKILPMENTGGRDLVESGQLCERKNGRGVDTNRNWPVDWGKKEKDYDPKEEYPGTRPFSEPEVQVIDEVTKQFRPHVWLNIHSGMEAMFTPYDHIDKVPEGAQIGLSMLHQIQAALFDQNCVVGSGGKSVGYLAHGTATDYMFQELHVPLPFTWEIYGDFSADYHDCFRMFNPVGREQFESVLTKWLKAIFMLIELLPQHPAIPPFPSGPQTPQEGAAATHLPNHTQQQQGQAQHAQQASDQTDGTQHDKIVQTVNPTDKSIELHVLSGTNALSSSISSSSSYPHPSVTNSLWRSLTLTIGSVLLLLLVLWSLGRSYSQQHPEHVNSIL